jgi:hypothetical protein
MPSLQPMRRVVVSMVAAIGVVAAFNPPVQAAITSPVAGSVVPALEVAPELEVVPAPWVVVSPAFASLADVSAMSIRTVATGRSSATGRKGQRLTVWPSRGLSSFGQRVTVRGTGFNERVGIYVGLCVKPRTGAKPTPCGGGVDQDGSSQASAWISSNPPPYGARLAKPYKPGGSFRVTIKVSPRIGRYDCRVVRCAIVARADHTRAYDRTWDVIVPVTFRR